MRGKSCLVIYIECTSVRICITASTVTNAFLQICHLQSNAWVCESMGQRKECASRQRLGARVWDMHKRSIRDTYIIVLARIDWKSMWFHDTVVIIILWWIYSYMSALDDISHVSACVMIQDRYILDIYPVVCIYVLRTPRYIYGVR